MKFKISISLIVAFMLMLAVSPITVSAQTPTPQTGQTYIGDQIVVANTFRLESGDVLEGNLLIIGGTATIAREAAVNGDIVLVGGTISIRGDVTGDIVAIGGAANIEDYAIINGDLVLIGATIKRSALSKINGTITEQTPKIFDFNFGNPSGVTLPFFPSQNPLTKMLNAALQAVALGTLAVIIGLLLPSQMKRVSDTVTREPLITGGVGLLTIVIVPILLVILTITIILIPVAILGILLVILAVLFGWIAVGHEIGHRIAELFKTTWHPSIAAGIGVTLLSLVTGFAGIIPCIGWMIGALVGILGIGAVVISRFGSSKYADKLIQSIVPPMDKTTSVDSTDAEPLEK